MDGIINTAHLTYPIPSGAFPISPNNDNEESSFAWADDETLESLPSITRTVQDDMQLITEQSIQLLDTYVYRDPLADLVELYRQEGISNIESYFQEHPLNQELCNYSFECPLQGTYFHSSLPLPLFGKETPHDLLVQLSHKVIGTYRVLEDGVYFTSRKHAKRATALAILESMRGDTSVGGGVMYPSPREALPRLGQLSPITVTTPVQGMRNKIKYFPAWVHELCRVGVTAKDLNITYQEQYTPAAWNNEPTMLACVVSVKTLVELTAVGMPCETKREALESAVGLLVEELRRQLPDLPELEPPSTDQLKGVLDCDPVNASYVYPLPAWASTPMPTPKELCSNHESGLYLYELELQSNQGHALFGVVFPCDPESTTGLLFFETEFDIPGDNIVSARLQKCKTLGFSEWSLSEMEQRMAWMKHFNKLATQTPKVKDIEDPPRDSVVWNRTYLIVPLARTGFGASRRSDVDWKMLQHMRKQSENSTTKSAPSARSNDAPLLLILGLLFLVAPWISEAIKRSGLALILFLLTLMVFTLLVHLPSKNPEPSPFHQQMMEYMRIFMPLLEREMQVAQFARQFCDMASKIQAEKSAGKSSKSAYECTETLPASVKEATTLIPMVTYQRLELLGDSVLGYFLGINLMGMNCSLVWDSDELARILSASANNRALRDAGLRSGISRLLFGERHSSAYPSTDQSNVVKSLLSIGGFSTGNVDDHILSDVVETLLGTAFLDGHDNINDPTGGRMVIALLQHYNLPLPNHDSKLGLPFFKASGPCIKSGYPFNQDKAWRRQLVQIGTTLYCEHEVINKLETGWLDLVGNIFSMSSLDRHRLLMEKQKAKILLLCSLFNDSLSDISEDGSLRRMDSSSFTSTSMESDLSSNPDSAVTPESGLIRIALLRDTIFMVGHSGLHLAITKELFNMYPDANDADLSLMRSCATSDDVMAYIMVKSGFHESLYHQNTRPERRFVSELGAAEDLGRKVWNRRFGWILKGGKQEYARRCAFLSFPMPQGLPRYCGLAGGRLYGHKSKLPDSLTEDLVFSMKAIAGALVLSLGLEGMWQSLGPLFGELLLLSADELRKEYRKNSSIVSLS